MKALTDSAEAVRLRGIDAFVAMGKHVITESHELQLQQQHGQNPGIGGNSTGGKSSEATTAAATAAAAGDMKAEGPPGPAPWVTSVLLPTVEQLLKSTSSKERQTGLFMVAKSSILLLGGRPRAVPKSLGALLNPRGSSRQQLGNHSHNGQHERSGSNEIQDSDTKSDDDDEDEYLSLPALSAAQAGGSPVKSLHEVVDSGAPSAAAMAAEAAALSLVLPLLVQKGFRDSLPTVRKN